ncbi:hypothetical protein [Haloarchaeobius sp. TZWWS8]
MPTDDRTSHLREWAELLGERLPDRANEQWPVAGRPASDRES